jgi:hypothetical protein
MVNNLAWGGHGLSWNIEVKCFIITRSTIWIAIEPCKCDWRSILPEVTTNLHYVKALFNPYLLGEACLHDDVDAKENLNKVLWKTTCTLTTYALTLKDFTIFFLSWGPFSNTLLVKDLDLFHMSGGILLELVDTHLHPSPITFCASVFHIIVWTKLEFIFICL